MTRFPIRSLLWAGTALAMGLSATTAIAAAAPAATPAIGDADNTITNSDDIIVSATKVNNATPITASIHTFEPQAIVSREIIDNSVAPTADYSQIVLLTPGATMTPSTGNGVGISDSKITLRGFTDGQYNMTYDGVPFGDSNDPTHHSTSYFPDGTYERIIVDRGPGAATDLGQASYGGNIHLISREPTDHFFVENQAVYGSFNTFLDRLTVNSGSIAKLGDLKIIAVGEYKRSDGALTNQPGWWANGYVKAEKPLGDNAQFSILANYNQSMANLSDASGGATSEQIALYGKDFGATTAADPGLYPNARKDWNWVNKTTDMEIARLQWSPFSNVHVDNKAYTYFYKNFTLSTEDSTTPCNVLASANQCIGSTPLSVLVKAEGTGPGGGGGATVAGDIAGYTKLNQYRNWGDILQVDVTTAIGALKVGGWYERSQSHRLRYDYDFTKASEDGGIGDGHFDFSIMNNGQNWNWKESDKSYNTELNGSYVPAYIKYDEYTSWDNVEGFGEFEFKLLHDTLTITPGVKAVGFTRQIDTPIAAQSSRLGAYTQESYKPVLPYATVNYLFLPNLSAYFQYAKGLVVPDLSSSLETKGSSNAAVPLDPQPTKTTNYQLGAVYAGQRLNIDADVYYIEASNSTYTDPTDSNTVTVNGNPALYKGVEGQISYVVVPGLTAIANGTIMSSKDRVTHLWLQGASNDTALLGAVYSRGRFKLSYLHKFTGRQFVDAANTTKLGAYSYGILSGSVALGRFTVGVTVDNPWNSRPVVSESLGSTAASNLYIFQAPASYEAQVRVRF